MTGELVLVTGATGHVGFKVLVLTLEAGYRVRAAIRRPEAANQIKASKAVQPYLENLEFTVVPDITADGAFDAAVSDVVYIEHIASPLPRESDNPQRDVIEPAVRGTLSILNSAIKQQSVRRIVITSSVVAIVPPNVMEYGDAGNTYSARSRVTDIPSEPYDPRMAYRVSKILALEATEKFVAERKPQFDVVNVMPSYVIGPKELATRAQDVVSGSNAYGLSNVLGFKSGPSVESAVHLDDVARIHVKSLDTQKIAGNTSYILNTDTRFASGIEVSEQYFPEAVKEGILPLGGEKPGLPIIFDVTDTVNAFGPLKSYEEAIKSVLGQYVELRKQESQSGWP